MDATAEAIDRTMEAASRALVAMNYPEAERLCLAALEPARTLGDWDRLARIMLPLQEARRQRRQIAADAGGYVLNGDRREPQRILDDHAAGLLILTDPPYSDDDAVALRRAARQRGAAVEVLHADPTRLASMAEKALEDLGDAALAGEDAHRSPATRIDALLNALQRVGDHELLHQRIAELARETQRAK